MTSDLVTIGHAYGPMETALACTMLEAAGIAAVPRDQQTAAICWHWTGALGGVAIMVPASRAEDARATLADFSPRRRPHSFMHNLFIAVLLFLWTGVPPPHSGYYAVRAAGLAPRARVERA